MTVVETAENELGSAADVPPPSSVKNDGKHLSSRDNSPSCYTPPPEHDENYTKTNLIVNYLPQHMTEDELRTLFSSIGPVESCKLVRDKLTLQSLGYAFVNYFQADDAKKAVETLNQMRLATKMIKVSYARPSSNEIKNANLYISGLPALCKEKDLRLLFGQYGVIITSKILLDNETGLSRGVGFVRYDKRAQAERAIEALHNKIPPLPTASKPLIVKFANPPNQKLNCVEYLVAHTKGIYGYGSTLPRGGQAMYPFGASPSMSPATPYKSCSPIGLSGYCYATSSPAIASCCVFVYNLPADATDLLLFQLFSKYGAIHSVKVVVDEEQKCRGYGFVNLMSYEDACNAIFGLNGVCLERGKPLQVSFKKPKAFN